MPRGHSGFGEDAVGGQGRDGQVRAREDRPTGAREAQTAPYQGGGASVPSRDAYRTDDSTIRP